MKQKEREDDIPEGGKPQFLTILLNFGTENKQNKIKFKRTIILAQSNRPQIQFLPSNHTKDKQYLEGLITMNF